jgi:glycosyltransferase involved in cell wall biosynthesis
LRIFVLSDTTLETPHPFGHGLGLMNHQIAEGLRQRGHDVTLFAKQGSSFSGALVPIASDGYAGERVLAKAAYQFHKQYPADVLIDGGHIHYLSGMFPELPVVNIFHDIYQPYGRCPVLLSEGQRAMMPPPFECARIIPNALDASRIQWGDMPGGYAVFLGAVSDLKQPMLAIEACARAGIPLVIAGMMVNNFALPLTKHNNARYIGTVAGESKFNLLRGARVLLQLSGVESFGLTTLEAMLCGTPVVALPSGGNVDLIEYGKSGILVQPSGDMVGAVVDAMKAARHLDRKGVRESAERFGSVDVQMTAYEDALADCMKGCWW